jgi:radical SAM superfamily enzyme YgiQ (UPF0313 family)
VEVVHDRFGIEIMRGCPQVCRFCHAGYTKRPLTYRSVERILELAEAGYAATGHEEISLLSLSTADYPHLPELAERLNARFGPRFVNLSFPSLRVDKMLALIPAMASQVRKGSITMAVEAARDDMRRAIRKKVTDGNLMDGVRAVYRAGWKRLKLYFMAGFPGEREDDIVGIWELSDAISRERWNMGLGGPGEVTASVGWLVPKPFTPLQWMAQPTVEYYERVHRKLREIAGGRYIPMSGSYGAAEIDAAAASGRDAPPPRATERKRGPRSVVSIRTHDARRSRLCATILEAWRRGSRFDGWDEGYRHEAWEAAFAATAIDPAWYANRERGYDELLPWSHIGQHMRREYLEKSYDDMFTQIGVPRTAVTVNER